MNEKTRRLLFLLLFAVVFFHQGGHISQAFVNYPAWAHISNDSFTEYHRVVTTGALWFLLLPRVVELLLAFLILRFPPAGIKRWWIVLAIALAMCAFLSTIFIARPIHAQLETIGNTPELLSRLRNTNWLRLTLELFRTALYFGMMSLIIRPQVRG